MTPWQHRPAAAQGCEDGAHHYMRHPLPARDGSIIWICTHGPHARSTPTIGA